MFLELLFFKTKLQSNNNYFLTPLTRCLILAAREKKLTIPMDISQLLCLPSLLIPHAFFFFAPKPWPSASQGPAAAFVKERRSVLATRPPPVRAGVKIFFLLSHSIRFHNWGSASVSMRGRKPGHPSGCLRCSSLHPPIPCTHSRSISFHPQVTFP